MYIVKYTIQKPPTLWVIRPPVLLDRPPAARAVHMMHMSRWDKPLRRSFDLSPRIQIPNLEVLYLIAGFDGSGDSLTPYILLTSVSTSILGTWTCRWICDFRNFLAQHALKGISPDPLQKSGWKATKWKIWMMIWSIIVIKFEFSWSALEVNSIPTAK